MDGKKVLEVIGIYRKYFETIGVSKENLPHDKLMGNGRSTLSHCHGMLDEMEKFVAEGRMDKVFRLLGFVQGCLWSAGYYDLQSLKNHNRPDPPNFRGHE